MTICSLECIVKLKHINSDSSRSLIFYRSAAPDSMPPFLISSDYYINYFSFSDILKHFFSFHFFILQLYFSNIVIHHTLPPYRIRHCFEIVFYIQRRHDVALLSYQHNRTLASNWNCSIVINFYFYCRMRKKFFRGNFRREKI